MKKQILQPISAKERKLNFFDVFVLWTDIGIGLLVLLAGAFLIPALSFPVAVISIIIGTILGSLLLATVGIIGTKYGLPTMVLLRSPLGNRGSFLPTMVNILQMIGWAVFEIVIMSYAANAITTTLFGFNHYRIWVLVVSTGVIILGISGPITVIKQWLKKFAFWIMITTSIWLTYRIFTVPGITKSFMSAGKGGIPFLQAIDLVIAMPISWIPVVADYNRFGKKHRPTFLGTLAGFSFANIWFYILGVAMALGASIEAEPKKFVSALLLTIGLPALLIILVDELDNAWADIYSATISLQNIFSFLKDRLVIIVVGLVSTLIALFLDITQYNNFLLLLSSFLVPLFGIFIAHYFFVDKKLNYIELFKTGGKYWYVHGVNIKGVASWVLGIIVYQFITYKVPMYGASIPSLGVSFVLYLILSLKKHENKN